MMMMTTRSAKWQTARVQRTAGIQQTSWCDATTSAPGERAQVHGDVPATADVLLALPRIHMVRNVCACVMCVRERAFGVSLHVA